MAVHDLGYQRWDGDLKRRRLRWLPMVRYHISLILKRKLIWLILLLSITPSLIFSGVVYISSEGAREGTALENMGANPLQMMRDPQEVPPTPVDMALRGIKRRDARDQQAPMTTEEKYVEIARLGLFLLLLWPQTFIVMLVASGVGAGLIAQDIRSNALEIYLTKPITALDYVKGKLCVVSFFIMLTTFVPALLVYIVAAASWNDFLSVTWPVLPRLFLVCLISAVVNGIVILGLSSLAKSARYATVIWFAMGFVSSASATFLSLFTENSNWNYFSYRSNFLYVVARILQVDVSELQGVEATTASMWVPVVILAAISLGAALIMRRTIRAVEVS